MNNRESFSVTSRANCVVFVLRRVLVKRDELTLEGIKQFFVAVEKEDFKAETLFDLYDT
jgi:hypothetical protein